METGSDPLAPRPGGPAWGKILGFGCGGCLLLVLLLGLLFGFAFRQLLHLMDRKPLPAAQLPYSGDWQGQDGSRLSIRADGSGSFRGGATKIEGAQVTIDPLKRTLEVGLFGISKRWHIDSPPLPARRS